MSEQPMPVGPAPQADSDLVKAPWGRGEDGRPRLPMGAHWTDIPELVDKTVAKIQGRVNRATSGHWYDASLTEAWRAPGTVCTRVDGYHRTVGQVTNMLSADVDLVLHAHDDLTWCLEMLAKFRAEISALRAERHSTNEALDDAVRALRARRDEAAPLIESPALPPRDANCGRPGCGHWGGFHSTENGCQAHVADPGEVVEWCPCSGFVVEADRITRLLAPTQALREDRDRGEHYAATHHDYRIPHDLPAPDGA